MSLWLLMVFMRKECLIGVFVLSETEGCQQNKNYSGTFTNNMIFRTMICDMYYLVPCVITAVSFLFVPCRTTKK